MTDTNSLQALLNDVLPERMIACLPGRNEIIFHDGDKEVGRIPFHSVLNIELIDDSTVKRQVTWIRFFLLGPLAFLIPKKIAHEAFRIRIQWKDEKGDIQKTEIPIPSKTIADYRFQNLQAWMNPDERRKMAEKAEEAARIRKAAEMIMKREQPAMKESSPFITCRGCTVEFRKTDLPSGGKCPVCGKRFKSS